MSPPSRLDRALLWGALAVGSAATLRAFGVGSVTLPAAALLAAAAIIAVRPLARIFGGREGAGARERGAVAVVLGAHIVATLFFFTPEDIANDRPVLTLDHALHFYQAERSRACPLRALPGLVYDPFFMAGYPGGMGLDLDSKGTEAWCSLFGGLGAARSYKLFILLAYLLLPFFLYAGCRRFGFDAEESIYGLLVFLVFWHWGRPYASHFRFAGMYSYVLSFQLAFYVVALSRSFLDGGRWGVLFLLGALAIFIHPAAAVLLPVPVIALLLAGGAEGGRRSYGVARSPRRLVMLAVWAAAVAAANAPWVIPFVRAFHPGAPATGYFQIEGLRGLAALLLKPGNVPALLLIVLACVGGVVLTRARRWRDGAAPVGGGVFLLALSAVGMQIPVVNRMEPGRFLVPALLFLSPLAGAGASAAARRVGRSLAATGGALAARTALGVSLVVLIPFLALANARAFYHHTLTTTYTPAVRALIGALKERIDTSGRLMIEDGPAWAYGNCLLPAILPLETGVEQIGGPYPHGFLPHHFATFRTCEAFGKPLAEMTPGALAAYLGRYNVHWILTATEGCRAAIAGLPSLTLLWTEGAFTLWEVEPAGGFATRPGVSVEATYDEIRVRLGAEGTATGEEPVLLKYHWDSRLEASAPALITPQAVPDDPVPFILLDPRGATDVRIVYR